MRTAACLALCLAWTCTARLAAQDPTASANAADTNPLLEIMPELQTAPPPAWVKAGVRLTYWTGAAIQRGTITRLQEDDQGQIIDPVTGKRYTEIESTVDVPLGEPGARRGDAGAGYTQVNVAAVGDGVAALQTLSYGFRGGKQLGLLDTSGGLSPAGVGGDYWAHPDVLANAVGREKLGWIIRRGRYTLDGTEHEVVRVIHDTYNGYRNWVFDARTGVLLHSGGQYRGDAAMPRAFWVGVGGRIPAALLMQTRLVNQRTLELPWIGDAMPPAVRGLRRLHYQGAVLTQPDPRIPGANRVFQLDLEPVATKADAIAYRYQQVTHAVVRDLPPNEVSGGGVAAAGLTNSFWLPPAKLARLRTGQQLDRDPVTGATTVVSHVGPLPQGGNAVVISEVFPGFRLDSFHDPETGLRIGATLLDPGLHSTLQFMLTGKE